MVAAEILTASDLAAGRFQAGDFAVLGNPIAHSLSPVMHQASLAALAPMHPNLRGRRYHRILIQSEELPKALEHLRLMGCSGVNLTVPHKVAAMSLIQEIDITAADCGATNTLIPTPRGWRGMNTDGAGFAEALAEKSGTGPEGRPFVILGAGGAARAVAFACLRLGCASILILNRGEPRRVALTEAINRPNVKHGPLTEENLPPNAVIVNCTPLGLKAEDLSPINPAHLHMGMFVFDATYSALPSALVQAARTRGIVACDGRPMLRWQGALAFKAWTGILPPIQIMAHALGEI